MSELPRDSIASNGVPERKNPDEWFLYYRKNSILGLHLLGALIAFFAPLDILSQSAAAKAFVDAVSAVVPMVANFTKHSTFPQILQFYGAVMLVTVPWWVWVWFRGPYQEMQVQRMRERAEGRAALQILLILFAVSAPFAMYVYLFVVTPTDFNFAPFQSERWALAIFGPIFYCWAPGGPLIIVVSSIDVLQRIWRGR